MVNNRSMLTLIGIVRTIEQIPFKCNGQKPLDTKFNILLGLFYREYFIYQECSIQRPKYCSRGELICFPIRNFAGFELNYTPRQKHICAIIEFKVLASNFKL